MLFSVVIPTYNRLDMLRVHAERSEASFATPDRVRFLQQAWRGGAPDPSALRASG